MTEHELTPCGRANCIVAECLMVGYRDDLQKKLDSVMNDARQRCHVPEEDYRLLTLQGFKVKGFTMGAQ